MNETLLRPGLDTWYGLDRVLEGPRSLVGVFVGLAIGWWIYVQQLVQRHVDPPTDR